MTTTRVGFGLLGTGMIAPLHAAALQASEKAALVAAADLNTERLSAFTEKYGCKAYTSYDEMLADPAIQVINILLPNHLHFEPVVKAARAGKHILVEKPPAMSLKEVDEMVAVCKEANVKIGTLVQCRTRKAIQAIKQAIEAGRFGKILHADTSMKWFRPSEYYAMDAWRQERRSGAGVTIAQLFHYIDLLQYLVGPVSRVNAQMTNLAHPQFQVEDTTLAFVDYACGAQGVVQASTGLWPGTPMRIEINGENGTAIVVGERMETWKFRDEQPEDEEIRQIGRGSAATGARGSVDLEYADHLRVFDDMVDAIAEDRAPCIPPETVRPTLEWALAMYQSAKEQTPVTLPILDEEAVWGSTADTAKA